MSPVLYNVGRSAALARKPNQNNQNDNLPLKFYALKVSGHTHMYRHGRLHSTKHELTLPAQVHNFVKEIWGTPTVN